jgi:hypothetical protein
MNFPIYTNYTVVHGMALEAKLLEPALAELAERLRRCTDTT